MTTEHKDPSMDDRLEEEVTEPAAEAQAEPQEELSTQATENEELVKAKKEAEENQQRLLRVQADFDNFRRRTQKEKEEFAAYASSKLVSELIPVLDNFERALNASKDTADYEALAKGVEMIFRQFDQVLASEGLKAIESVGQPFNPEFHQAVMQEESSEYESGIVMEELQKGYMLKDRVLRPAMVKVSS